MNDSRTGISFGRGLSPSEVVQCVRLAESLGYDSAWMSEGHAGDQFAILGACAAVTGRIRLGTSISSVFVRSAPTIAMAAATVDQLSGGRFVLGLGTSHREQVEPEHGLVFEQPTARLRDTIEITRALLRDGAVAHKGRVVSIGRFDLWFTPHRRQLPVFVSALFPRMLEICGEIADGVLLVWSTVDAAARAAEHVARGAARAGRDAAAIEIGAMLPCAVARTRQEARDRLRPVLAFYAGYFSRYNRLLAESGFPEAVAAVKAAWDRGDAAAAARAVPDALVDAVAVAGPSDECRERVERYRQAGLRLPIISPRMAQPSVASARSAIATSTRSSYR